jgi:hypothetical protein
VWRKRAFRPKVCSQLSLLITTFTNANAIVADLSRSRLFFLADCQHILCNEFHSILMICKRVSMHRFFNIGPNPSYPQANDIITVQNEKLVHPGSSYAVKGTMFNVAGNVTDAVARGGSSGRRVEEE